MTNYTFKPMSDNCRKLYEEKKHALIGISPFNSYYNQDNILKELTFVFNNFEQVNIFVPDVLPVFTFLALGVGIDKALRKTRQQANYLKNKINKCLQALNIKDEHCLRMLSEFEQNQHYIKIKQLVLDKYSSDVDFRSFCLNSCREVFCRKKIVHFDATLAVYYFLYETPLLIATPFILQIPTSVFIYHNVSNFLSKLLKFFKDVVSIFQQSFVSLVDKGY